MLTTNRKQSYMEQTIFRIITYKIFRWYFGEGSSVTPANPCSHGFVQISNGSRLEGGVGGMTMVGEIGPLKCLPFVHLGP